MKAYKSWPALQKETLKPRISAGAIRLNFSFLHLGLFPLPLRAVLILVYSSNTIDKNQQNIFLYICL